MCPPSLKEQLLLKNNSQQLQKQPILLFGCRTCDFYLCPEKHAPFFIDNIFCQNAHKLVQFTNSTNKVVTCSVCQQSLQFNKGYTCNVKNCQYNIYCTSCLKLNGERPLYQKLFLEEFSQKRPICTISNQN